MSLLNDLTSEVAGIFRNSWSSRAGSVVPEAEAVALGNDAVKLDGTVLYADLVASTALVSGYKAPFAAEIYKAYLVTAYRIIRDSGGVITAYDGDRIMAVFIGDSKNSNAARAALKINWGVQHVVNPAIKKQYPDTSYQVRHVAGVDTGALFVARTGVRGTNDLVWVGSAANLAAKLCDVRVGTYRSFVTEKVYGRLNQRSKYGGSPKRLMWDKLSWEEEGLTIYGSTWWWKIP